MRRFTSFLLAIVSVTSIISGVAFAQSHKFTAISWNVASGRADLQMSALRVAGAQGVDLWGLCEVRNNEWAKTLVRAAGENEPGEFVGIVSATTGNDLSCIIYDRKQFDFIQAYEIKWFNRLWYYPGMQVRPPLVAHLRHLVSDQEFLFVVNRLYSCQIEKQAGALNAWAQSQSLPIIAVGTYDFQYDPYTGPLYPEGQKALLAFVADGAFRWLAPANPIATFNWDREVIDDFVFFANTLGKLSGESQVIVEPGDFINNGLQSDHRPVQVVFSVSDAAHGTVSNGSWISTVP